MNSSNDVGYLLRLAKEEFERRDGAGTCPQEIENFLEQHRQDLPRRFKWITVRKTWWETLKHFAFFGTWSRNTEKMQPVLPGDPDYADAPLQETFVVVPYIGDVVWENVEKEPKP